MVDRRHNAPALLAVGFAAFLGVTCTSSTGGLNDGELPPGFKIPPTQDTDGDGIPDVDEDRNQDGMIQPGETDPDEEDSDADGIPDGREVQVIACAGINDRPFAVIDAPGADAMILVDEKVGEHATLRTTDNKAPAIVLGDATADVAAILLKKRPAMGVGDPAGQREVERRGPLARVGEISNVRQRSFTTVEGFAAEQAIMDIRTRGDVDARTVVAQLAPDILGGVPLTGGIAAGGKKGRELRLQLLTVWRGPTKVVMVAAVAVGPFTEAQELRLDELTDGSNVARHGAFTRHVCDTTAAKAAGAADILVVVDDSGSMEDDQAAVREAASAMEQVLTSAKIDFRLGVARMWAQNQRDPRRGDLEGRGLTANVQEFKDEIVVGAQGGWEPGLETGIKAIDSLLPKTAAGAPARADKLRDGAGLVVVILSDERDQAVQCTACGSCDAEEHGHELCQSPQGTQTINQFISAYQTRGATVFAIVGDLPNGCQQSATNSNFEPGQGYVEVANATGGQFGSLCGDMRRNMMDVARVANGVASTYQLSAIPASATLRVASGPAGMGRAIPRSRTNGFDYDAVRNTIVFYGDARPKDGDEVIIGYRVWDWAGNPDPSTPPDACDECEVNTSCLPTLDVSVCSPICGDVSCMPGLVCLPDTATCGDPSQLPTPPNDACGECDAGRVCNPTSGACVIPCETTGCRTNEICSSGSHLCVPSGI